MEIYFPNYFKFLYFPAEQFVSTCEKETSIKSPAVDLTGAITALVLCLYLCGS